MTQRPDLRLEKVVVEGTLKTEETEELEPTPTAAKAVVTRAPRVWMKRAAWARLTVRWGVGRGVQPLGRKQDLKQCGASERRSGAMVRRRLRRIL